MAIKKESKEPLYDITDRGYNVKAWYIEDNEEYNGDALVTITKKNELIREFVYPAYKIYNIAAHFRDIVNSELGENDEGYKIAGSTGFGGFVAPRPINND